MLDLELSTTLLTFLLPFLFLLIIKWSSVFTTLFPSKSPHNSATNKTPKSYPLIGSFFSIYANRSRNVEWTSALVTNSPTSTLVLRHPLGRREIFTANPSNVQHILKSHFHIYQKGNLSLMVFRDLLGEGIFNTNGESWKFQRQFASHEFNTKSLRKFVENAVDTELNDRLIPILSAAAKNDTVLDLQDVLQRFAFDNVCAIAFGYDPASLVQSLPQVKLMTSFEDAIRISTQRLQHVHPLLWKAKRLLNFGSEKNLRNAVEEIRQFAKEIIKEKKQRLDEKSELESFDLLSRFLSSGHSDENFVTDIVISFLLAGRDATSAALVWFFWLVSRSLDVEGEILKEIYEKSKSLTFEEVKDMVYTHASLSESMRLYPPLPVDGKQAVEDDMLPDGTFVKKGTAVVYHPYAMGRSEKIWGKDWAEFKPERWLQRDDAAAGAEGKWNFIGRDPYTYPVFQAGPRICLGKEMAFLQMKTVVVGVLRRFRVVPAFEEGKGPVFVSYITTRMDGGFPVRIEERDQRFWRRRRSESSGDSAADFSSS